jgi:hypothetical protein
MLIAFIDSGSTAAGFVIRCISGSLFRLSVTALTDPATKT